MSGGVIMRGAHLLAHWCRLQEGVALSSGEAELYSTNRSLSRYVGVVNLFREVFHPAFAAGFLRHPLDASATRSMIMREGLGGIKHLEIRDLWCQEIVRQYRIEVLKIGRESNVADLLASPTGRADMCRFLRRLGVLGLQEP